MSNFITIKKNDLIMEILIALLFIGLFLVFIDSFIIELPFFVHPQESSREKKIIEQHGSQIDWNDCNPDPMWGGCL